MNSYGKPDKESLVNIQHFIDVAGLDVWYDEFALKAYIRHGARTLELDDAVLAELQFAMHKAGLKAGKNIARDGVMRAARKKLRHPVREYLSAVQWDGTERVDTWLTRYVGAKDTALNRTFGRKFLIAAVRRIRSPGEMVRAMPVLEGPQNLGKSKVFRALAVKSEWFTDSLEIGASSKEVIEQTAGHWFVECAEMSGMKRSEVENVKAFVSRTEDVARLSYGHFTSKFPRQFVLAGTTNDERYLKDKTGNTRFWSIRVGKLVIDSLKRDVDQLWAEAVEIEASGEVHWLTDAAMIESAALESEKREELSPVEEQWVSLLNNAPDCFLPASALWEAVGLSNAKDRTTAHGKSMGAVAVREGWRRTKRRASGQQVGGYVPTDVGADKVERLKEGRYCPFSRAIKTVSLH